MGVACVECDRDILAGYHVGSVGSIRAKTGVPGGRGEFGGVGAGVMVGLKAVASYVAPSGVFGVGCYGGVPSGRRRVFWFRAAPFSGLRGRFRLRFCVWLFVLASIEESRMFAVTEGAREGGEGRVLLVCGARELMLCPGSCDACVQSRWWMCVWRTTSRRRCLRCCGVRRRTVRC